MPFSCHLWQPILSSPSFVFLSSLSIWFILSLVGTAVQGQEDSKLLHHWHEDLRCPRNMRPGEINIFMASPAVKKIENKEADNGRTPRWEGELLSPCRQGSVAISKCPCCRQGLPSFVSLPVVYVRNDFFEVQRRLLDKSCCFSVLP